jgi:hypothetical protein
MYWEKVNLSNLSTDNSLAWIELRLVLAHFAYLFDAQLVPSTNPGYKYTVVIHPGAVQAILTPTSSLCKKSDL